LIAGLTAAEHDFIPPDAGVRSDEWEDIMKIRYTVAQTVGGLLFLGLVLPTGEAVSQQAGPTSHRYLVRDAGWCR